MLELDLNDSYGDSASHLGGKWIPHCITEIPHSVHFFVCVSILILLFAALETFLFKFGWNVSIPFKVESFRQLLTPTVTGAWAMQCSQHKWR
jgi:hypothetical protein